jgi:hypothetical protein
MLDATARRLFPLLLAAICLAAVAAGCGGDGDSSADDQKAIQTDLQLKDQAAAKAKRAANEVVSRTRDRNLPGPKRYLAVCQRRGDPDAGDIPPDVVKCHIEAFYKDYKGKQGGYIWSEDWHVPIVDGKLGEPVIAGEYRIRNFLLEDHKRNCTGRHRPRECLPQSVGGTLPG